MCPILYVQCHTIFYNHTLRDQWKTILRRDTELHGYWNIKASSQSQRSHVSIMKDLHTLIAKVAHYKFSHYFPLVKLVF